jgi:hypothetical protein
MSQVDDAHPTAAKRTLQAEFIEGRGGHPWPSGYLFSFCTVGCRNTLRGFVPLQVFLKHLAENVPAFRTLLGMATDASQLLVRQPAIIKRAEDVIRQAIGRVRRMNAGFQRESRNGARRLSSVLTPFNGSIAAPARSMVQP